MSTSTRTEAARRSKVNLFLRFAEAHLTSLLVICAVIALGIFLRPSPFDKLGAEQPVLSVLVDEGGVVSTAMDQAGLFQLSSNGTAECVLTFWFCHGGKVTGITRALYLEDGKPPPIPLPSLNMPLEGALSKSDIPALESIPAPNDDTDPDWAWRQAQSFVDGLAFTIVRIDPAAAGPTTNIRVYVNVDKEAYDAPFVAQAVRLKTLAAIGSLTKRPKAVDQRELQQKMGRARSWNP